MRIEKFIAAYFSALAISAVSASSALRLVRIKIKAQDAEDRRDSKSYLMQDAEERPQRDNKLAQRPPAKFRCSGPFRFGAIDKRAYTSLTAAG